MLADQLDGALRAAGIPIVGVSLTTDDRSTWAVQFTDAATPAQRTQAAGIVAAFTHDADADMIASIEGGKALKAVVLWCAQRFGVTPAQARAQILAIYKSL